MSIFATGGNTRTEFARTRPHQTLSRTDASRTQTLVLFSVVVILSAIPEYSKAIQLFSKLARFLLVLRMLEYFLTMS